MNMQLRHCFSRANPFRLKLAFLIFKKSQSLGVQKQPEFQNLASKKPNWQPWLTSVV